MHTIIIGNGISGTTCARFLRKLDPGVKITILSKETKYPFSRTALMYVYMGHSRWEDLKLYEDCFYSKNRISLIEDNVEQILFDSKEILTAKNGTMPYDNLVLATGSTPNKFGWPGQDLKRVGGLYHKQDLENIEKYSHEIKHATIVGGGLIGIEMAEMFRSRGKQVSLIVREKSYWSMVLPKEESEMINRHIIEHHINLRLGVNLDRIESNKNGEAKAIVIKETQEEIECQYVGLTAGVHPNIDFLKGTGLEINRGILVNQYLETNKDSVYAIGDCAELKTPGEGRRGIEAVWYTGKMMGETLAYTILDKKISYQPRLWFNSAKFLDIEYQVYGYVPAQGDENIEQLYWEHSEGKKSIRICFTKEDKTVVGFNLMGIRFRHEVCEKWILNKTKLEEVLENLALANFDPEFFEQHEEEILKAYNNKYQRKLKVKQKRNLNSVFTFLNR